MPRYLVERTYLPGPEHPTGLENLLADHVERDSDLGVSWLHSYVSRDEQKSFCICDAPSPEAIRKTASRNRLPVDRITEVRVLDPYPYPG
ncbi:MAG TPA: DUF4242 domain-containing protein [Gaiellaceae bacterium]